MKILLILTALALPFIPNESNANEAYIGLKTYHFDRGGRDCPDAHARVAGDGTRRGGCGLGYS